MKYINIDAIEQIEVVHEQVAPYYKAHYEPEHTNFFGKIVPESVVYRENSYSIEDFLQEYGNKYFIHDQKVFKKAHIVFQFTSKKTEAYFYDSNEEADEKANEITKNWNRIVIS
ncbi:MAG: hypothetical protein ACTTH6_01810 [Candidatus Altimarinota bacterium]